MKHIMTRDEAIVAAELLSNLAGIPNRNRSAYMLLTVERRIGVAHRLASELERLLATTSDYFTVEGK